MDETPFRDAAKRISRKMDYMTMSVIGDRARSHGWWKNLVEYGAWDGPSATRVGPPTPEALPGIAKLFGVTEDQVAEMIAADWYGVQLGETSARVQMLGPMLDRLSDADAELVEQLARRLLVVKVLKKRDEDE